MRRSWTIRLAAAAAGATLAVTAVAAEGVMVTVNLDPIRADLAKSLKVDAAQVPNEVQAPSGLAATVCNVTPEFLGTQAASGAKCDAKTTDPQLIQSLRQQLKAQKK